jgi:hypothetical protein
MPCRAAFRWDCNGAFEPSLLKAWIALRLGLSLCAICAVSAVAARAEEASLQYAVEATYLPKFAPFVTWPAAPKANFVLCVSGNDEVTKFIPEAIAGQQVNGRPIALHALQPGESAEGCQMLYIAASPAAAQLLASVRGKPVLTITEAARDGHGIIGFLVVQDHVRFDIDDNLAQGSGLAISSKLLSLAHAVTPAETR